jgi:hypothetical protein
MRLRLCPQTNCAATPRQTSSKSSNESRSVASSRLAALRGDFGSAKGALHAILFGDISAGASPLNHGPSHLARQSSDVLKLGFSGRNKLLPMFSGACAHFSGEFHEVSYLFCGIGSSVGTKTTIIHTKQSILGISYASEFFYSPTKLFIS